MGCLSHTKDYNKIPSAPLPIISVDGVTIEEEAFAAELQYHQDKNFDVVVQEAGQSLVVRQLLINHAKNNGIKISKTNEEEVLQQIISDNVIYNDPSNEDCARYFENNQAKFATLPLMEVDHILLAAAKDDFSTREVAKNNAKDIITKLKNDPLLFPVLANEYSACPSKKMGGSLGQLSKGQTVPEFERQLMTLSQGLSEKPIESRYGYHVVNITRKIEGKPLEYSMVQDKVKGYLIHRASHLAIQAFIQSLIEKAEIKGITMKFREENIHL